MQSNNWHLSASNSEQYQHQNQQNQLMDGTDGAAKGQDSRIERLQQQIQEAKASLHHYVQNSPLRQRQQATTDQPQLMMATTYHQREETAAADNRSRDQQQESLQGGYTEFFSWGNDDKGQLGHGADQNNPKRTLNLPKSLSFEVLIISVSCGAQHSGFITHEGHVFTFGSNLDGQLGIDDRNLNQSTAPLLVSSLLQSNVNVKKISCGSYHTMVQTEQDQVYCWGRNVQGQCGQSPNVAQKFFGPQLLNFEASHPVSRIECGDLNSAIVTKAGQLYTFGDNSQGQLGLGNGVFRSQIVVDKPTRVQDIYDEVVQVSCGYRHTLALTIKGNIYGFGSNRRHEMGLGESPQAVENNFYAPLRLEQLDIHNIVHTAAGGFSAAITDQNQLIVWGTGQFGVFSTPQKVCMDGIYFSDIQISKQESSFATAIDQKGAVYTWGPNFDGQLGQGDFNTRTLPTQIMRLKRKQIRAAALGDRYAIAIGKDVSMADLKRRKAAKARKQQQQQEPKQQHNTSASALRLGGGGRDNYHRVQDTSNEVDEVHRSGEGPPSHRRLNSMQNQQRDSSYQRGDAHHNMNQSSHHNRSFENMRRDSRQHSSHLDQHQQQIDTTNCYNQQPLRTTQKTRVTHEHRQESAGQSGSPIPSQTMNSNNFQITTSQQYQKQNHSTLVEDGGNRSITRPGGGSNSPLRQRSRGSTDGGFRPSQISAPSAAVELQRNNVTNHTENVTSPAAAPNIGRVSLTSGAESAAKRHHSELERLFHIQLDEKEGVVRQQQTTIQELRVQLTADARNLQNRIDELNDKLRVLERERNDLRTRLASELRNYQISKEELLQKNRQIEDEFQQERQAHQTRENRLYEENKNRELMIEERHRLEQENAINQLEEQHRNHCGQLESRHRNDIHILEEKARGEALASQRKHDELMAEIQNLRNMYEQEHSKFGSASDDIQMLEGDKRSLQETIVLRGKEIRDLQENNERTTNHLKAVEIERDTIQERMQVTVAQMNQDISELQKSIGLQNVRLDEGKQREQDLQRQLEHERDMVCHRDRRIDEMITEITCLRKQIEDQNYRISEIDAARSDLNQRFEDLRIECSTQQEKLKNSQQQIENQDNMLQSTRLSLERERQRADQNQNDLDSQTTINNALRRDLMEEQRRVKSRESDIQNLEMSLNHLKESMGQEFAAKSRDFENLKKAFEELQNQNQDTSGALNQRNEELDSAHTMNRELQAHANTLLDKVTYQESVIADLEEKNKRLTDLLNQHLNDRAANYKEKVLSKLTERDRSPHQSAAAMRASNMTTMDLGGGRSVSPFNEITNQRNGPGGGSTTPDQNLRRPLHHGGGLQEDDSTRRLAKILRREQGEQDVLRSHYVALQRQLNQEKFQKTPIRSHEIDHAAIPRDPRVEPVTFQTCQQQLQREATVSMSNIGGATVSPVHGGPPSDNIPPAIFSTNNPNTTEQGLLNYRSLRDSLNISTSSPLRSNLKSPKGPITAAQLRERETLATQVASMNHSTMADKINLQPPTGGTQTAQYSPLRSKTPPAGVREAKEADAKQLQNQSISASNISHRVMMNELRNLRCQIAEVQRQKNDLEGRLSNYEANQV